MTQNIQKTYFFQQQPAEVWEYLTNAELLAQWMMENTFKPVIGHKFHFNCDGGATYCEVTELVPNKRLSYTWKSNKPEKNIIADTVVTWTLTEKNGGTELQLLHTGFTPQADIEGHLKGWAQCIANLTECFKTSKV